MYCMCSFFTPFCLQHCPSGCSLYLILNIYRRMVHKGDLVIIGISVGLTIGIFIASLVFFGIRWYKKRAYLRRCSNVHSASTLPIHSNGLSSTIDSSAYTTDSVSVNGLDNLAKNSQISWWSNRHKARLASASGIPRYSHKYVISNTSHLFGDYSGLILLFALLKSSPS